MRNLIISCFFLAIVFPFPTFSQCLEVDQKITPTLRSESTSFGNSIEVSGHRSIIGAKFEFLGATIMDTLDLAGAAYIFERDGSGAWLLAEKLLPAGLAIEDEFGSSVSIDGDYAIVGAPHDEDNIGPVTLFMRGGAAYIFERDGGGTWNEVSKILPPNRLQADEFGESVSISGDYAVIGSPAEDEDADELNTLIQAGSAYIYKRDAGGAWNFSQKIVAPDRKAGKAFGTTIVIDGTTIMVGTPKESELEFGGGVLGDAGAVYVYDMDTLGVWNFTRKLVPQARFWDGFFGTSLDLEGDRAVIGAIGETVAGNTNAGAVYVLERIGGQWVFLEKITEPIPTMDAQFGISVAIAGDWMLAGSPAYDGGAGTAYWYQRSLHRSWDFKHQVFPADPEPGDNFGAGVGLDGGYGIVGAIGEDENILGVDSVEDAGAGYVFDIESSECRNYLLSGKVYWDSTLNCMPDSFEQGLPVIVAGNSFATLSSSSGEYILSLPDSIPLVLAPVVLAQYEGLLFNPCPAEYTETLDVTWPADTTGFDFGFEANPCPVLHVDISSNRRRLCANNFTTVHYANSGVFPAYGVEVHVEFPLHVSFVSADHPHTLDPLGNYVFLIDTLLPGASGTIEIIDEVGCDTDLLGLTQCTRSWITPYNNCLYDLDTASGWDSSHIELQVNCIGDTLIQFVVSNTGSGNMDSPRELRMYENGLLVWTSSYQLVAGDSVVLEVIAAGSTFRLEADQDEGHPGHSAPSTSIQQCGSGGGPFSTGFVTQHTSDDHSLDIEEHCLDILGSFDPNDKMVTPSGVTSGHLIEAGTLLEYQIRFQNTGSDTAFRVYVIDTLDPNLDLTTLEFGASSHPYDLFVYGSGPTILKFDFSNIYLPHEAVDTLGSQGFIKFKAAPYDTLAPGTEIHNQAHIYFDFNDPITTNDAWVAIQDSAPTGAPITVNVLGTLVGTSTVNPASFEVRFLPNPVTGDQGTLLIHPVPRENLQLELFTLQGKSVGTREFVGASQLRFSLGDLSNGIYLYRLKGKTLGEFMGKVIVVR